jgi:hypothetical protein
VLLPLPPFCDTTAIASMMPTYRNAVIMAKRHYGIP